MQSPALVVALAAGAVAVAAVAYETLTTTAVTTYCPGPTTLVHGSLTWTVTEATTLTITDCPCTITQPVAPPAASTVFYTSCPPDAPDAPAYTNPRTASSPSPATGTGTAAPYATFTGTAAPFATFTGAAAANTAGRFVAGAAALAVLAL
ncbi:unnamed protein product [Diplocarpon coronariae]